jgi:hypothetical protein
LRISCAACLSFAISTAFTDRDGLRVGAVVTVLVLVAITASVPYWRAIGLITR